MNETSTSDSAVQGKPTKTVLLSYRFADESRFDVVRQIAVRLRFFSIEVVLDQRSLDYGEDIKEFMRREIRKADAIILVITDDYNRALSASSGPGEGVRFEVQAAIQEKTIRPNLQIIPLLLDGIRPVPPFDQMKCAVPEAIDEVITQLGLDSVTSESRVLRQRYRVDQLIEMRGFARIFHGWDMVADLPIEIYLVPAVDKNLRYRFDLFERVVKGRSSAFSPFLLNIRDTYIDSEGGYYLITERFDGTDLGVPLARGEGTHPFGALCLAFQVSLALHELHSVGVIHGGLSPRCIRLNQDQTSCKIVDFEFATPQEFVSKTTGALEGYPQVMPPERFRGLPASIQQDVYQVGNLILNLICGRSAVSRLAPALYRSQHTKPLEVEDPNFRQLLLAELSSAMDRHRAAFASGNPWLDERVRETSSQRFVAERLAPLLAWCLAREQEERPRNCLVLLSALKSFEVPVVGHLVDSEGTPAVNGLFPIDVEA
jgi:hypothetical protein